MGPYSHCGCINNPPLNHISDGYGNPAFGGEAMAGFALYTSNDTVMSG